MEKVSENNDKKEEMMKDNSGIPDEKSSPVTCEIVFSPEFR